MASVAHRRSTLRADFLREELIGHGHFRERAQDLATMNAATWAGAYRSGAGPLPPLPHQVFDLGPFHAFRMSLGWLVARVSGIGFLDLLQDLAEVVGFRSVQRWERHVGLKLL
jgi:hypothetical protein